jgi:WD40 repeat protein
MITRHRALWLLCPVAGAIIASLTAVLFFVGLLGLVFLPAEARRLLDNEYVSVTHCLDMGAGRPLVSLYWTIERTGTPGWKHRLSVRSADRPQSNISFPNSEMKPLSLAKGPDSDHALVGDWDGGIYSLDLRCEQPEPVHVGQHADGGVVALASSADGQWILSQGAFQLHAWNVQDQRELWQSGEVAPYCFVIRPDSTAAIIGSSRGDLIEIDMATGESLRTLARLDSQLLTIGISDLGDKLAVLKANGSVLLLDSHTGLPLWNDEPRTCQIAAGRIAAFSPCGTWLVTPGHEDGKALSLWNVATGERQKQLHGHGNIVIGAAFNESGLLRSWGADGTIRSWILSTGEAQLIAVLMPPAAFSRRASGSG